MRITSPSGRPLDYEYVRHVEHPSGDWTWVGRLRGGAPSDEAVITFGERAAFGSIAEPGRPGLRLVTRDGAAWLVETDSLKIAEIDNAATRPRGPDFLIPPKLAAATAASDTSMPAAGAPVMASDVSASATTIVDVVVGYTTGFASGLGGTSQALTRINNLVEITNEAYANSQIDARVRLVHAMAVNYPDNTANVTVLQELTGYRSGSGSIPVPAALQPLRDARETYGGDLVTLVRAFRDPENDGCGIAWLLGGGRSGIDTSDSPYGYSIVSDGEDVTNGKTYFCREETFAHELGHNMGSQHDVATATDAGVVNYGVYSYSFGYKTGATTGNFYTLMAYGDSGQVTYRVFSNPAITFCDGRACGVANQADNARSLRQTLPIIAGFRATVVVDDPPPGGVAGGVLLKQIDVNGNGTSDFIFFQHSLNRLVTWFMSGTTRTAAFGTSIDGAYRVIDTGDFDRDKRGDLLLTGPGRDVVLGISTGVAHTYNPLNINYADGYRLLGLADVNGDGRSDILVRRDSTGVLTVWYMSGTTRYAFNSHTFSTALAFIGSGDLNGDGRGDLLWRDGSGRVFVSLSTGTAFTTTNIGLTHSVEYQLSGLQDVNGDGRSDIILHSTSLNRLVVWYMNGATRYAFNAHVTPGGFRPFAKGDFDGNKRGDVVLQNPATLELRLMLSSGTAFSTQAVTITPSGDAWLMDNE